MKRKPHLLLILIVLFQFNACASNEEKNKTSNTASSSKVINESNKNTESKMTTKQTEFDGIYINNSTTPRIFILKDNKFILFRRKYDDKLPTNYYYDKEEVNNFSVKNGQFYCSRYELTFKKETGKIMSFKDSYDESVKINSLKEIFQVNEWDARALLKDLMENHGMSEEGAKALFLRNDLFEKMNMDFSDKYKFNMRELALNFNDDNLGKVETVSNKMEFEGVYGFANDTRLDQFLIVKDGYFKWFRLTTDVGNQPHELQFKYVYNISSQEPVTIKDKKYSYNRDREYGQFIVENGTVTGVKSGTVELVKHNTPADLLKNNPIDAKALMQELIANQGFSAEEVKKIASESKLIDLVSVKGENPFTILDIFNNGK